LLSRKSLAWKTAVFHGTFKQFAAETSGIEYKSSLPLHQNKLGIQQFMSEMLAGDQRLSKSILWDIQRQFFMQKGVSAWQENIVPHYISSNPFMARTYNQIVLGYLRDMTIGKLNINQPIYIIELGAGSGRLAHHFLHQFYAQFKQSTLDKLPVKYIMTDFVPANIDFWQQHKKFKFWVEAGLLDFALFDIQAPQPLELVHAQETLTPSRVQNPFILIANYFFDSIPQDSFTIEDGQLCENLLTVYSTQPEPDLTDPAIWNRLSLAYEAIPLQQPYYDDDDFNQILALYEEYFPDTKLLFPNVGLECLKFWQNFGNGRYLLLTSDRGHSLAESLLNQDDPLPNLHGSFSLMVNYHAISQYVELQNGLVFQPRHYQNNLQAAAYLLGQTPQNGAETSLAFTNAMLNGGPDDFFSLKTALENHYHSLTLPQILSFLRFSAWDADIFLDCFPFLREQIKQESDAWHTDVYQGLTHIWEQYFPLSKDDKVAHAIQTLLDDMGYDKYAITA
jgi:hypothetical protein